MKDEMLVSNRSLGYYIPKIEAFMKSKGVTVDLLKEMKLM
jgi:transcriptional antiterminator